VVPEINKNFVVNFIFENIVDYETLKKDFSFVPLLINITLDVLSEEVDG
jgi:hypothetical protein